MRTVKLEGDPVLVHYVAACKMLAIAISFELRECERLFACHATKSERTAHGRETFVST